MQFLNKALQDAADPAAGGAAADPAPGGYGKNHILSPQAMKERLNRAIEKGRKGALADLEAKATAAGFKNADEMFARIASLKPRDDKDKPRDRDRDDRRERDPKDERRTQGRDRDRDREQPRENRKEREERERVAARAKEADVLKAKNLRLKARLEKQDSQHRMERMLVQHGVTEVDVTAVLLKKKIESLAEDEIKAFDEDKWVDEIRKSKPFLFGVKEVPANTGSPANPGNQQQGKGPTTTEPFDAMSSTDAQVREWANKNGFTLPN